MTGSQQPQVIQLQGNTQPLNTNAGGVLQLVQQVITPTGEIQHIPVSSYYIVCRKLVTNMVFNMISGFIFFIFSVKNFIEFFSIFFG